MDCWIFAAFLLIFPAVGNCVSDCSFQGRENNIIFGNKNTLFMIDLVSNKTRSFEKNGSGIFNADYHYTEGSIYFSEWKNQTISRIRCHSSTVVQYDVIIQVTGGLLPYGVAVDSINNHLYWTEFARNLTGKIRISDLDGSNNNVIISSSQKPMALVLDATNQWLYFTDAGSHTIEKCKLDGSLKQAIISTDLITPYGLALDFREKRIYWTDTGNLQIKSAKLDGTDIKLLGAGLNIVGLDLYCGNLYIAELSSGVYKLPPNQEAVPVYLTNDVYGVKIVKKEGSTDGCPATTAIGSTNQSAAKHL